jgi:hypothetical protein
VLSDNEFSNECRRRFNDEFWKELEYIQTVVKSKIGTGEPFIINYYAPLTPT